MSDDARMDDLDRRLTAAEERLDLRDEVRAVNRTLRDQRGMVEATMFAGNALQIKSDRVEDRLDRIVEMLQELLGRDLPSGPSGE